MSDVFISYSRVDKDFVRKLHQSLSELERDVWVDWEDIPPTADWWKEIQDGIDAADTFVFVISPDSARSPVCYEEVGYAVSQNKRFVPILYRDVTDAEDLEKMHPVINTHNWVFFRSTDNFMSSLQTLINAVETDLGYVRKHTQLLVQARDWIDHNRGNSYLLDGQQIAAAEQWLSEAVSKKPEPTDLHIEFITASRRQETGRQRRLFGAVLVALFISIGLAIFGFVQSVRATNALTESEARGTQVAFEGTNVAVARATAVFNYNQAQTQEFIANENANKALTAQFNAESNANFARTQEARAQNLLVTSEFQGEQIALEVTNVYNAQATAQFNADNAQTQQVIAENNANFARTQEARAQNLLVTSEFQGEQIALEITNVAAAQSTAEFNAAVAQTQQIIAENAANFARTQEARAQNLLVTSEFQGEQIAFEVTNVYNAQATAQFNADNAQTQQVIAENNANFARTQEARAQDLLVTSEYQGGQIAFEVTNVYNAQSTAEFNAQVARLQQEIAEDNAFNAQTQEARAVISANNAQTQEARAQNLLVTSEAQGTQIALEVTNVYNAQSTSVYNEQQALGQSLAVNAELAINTGNYDLAFALALESYNLRPDLTQAQRVLNQIVYSSARFSFDDTKFAQFTPDSEHIIINQGDDLVMYEIRSRNEARRFEGHTATITGATLSVDGTRLVSGDTDGNVILWDTTTGDILQTYRHDAAVGAVAINNDNTRILSGDETSLVMQWDARGSTSIFSYQNVASRPIRRLRFSPDNRNFFVWSDTNPDGERFMGLWSLNNGNRVYEVDDNASGQEAFIDIAERTGYAYADETSTIKVYQSSNYSTVREIRDRIDFGAVSVGARTFNDSGNRIMVVLENKERGTGQVIYYDISNGGELLRLQNVDEQIIGAVAVSPDEIFALTADLNQLVLWNMQNGREIRRLSAHNDDISEIEFSPDGQFALSRDRSGNVRVWDIAATETVEVGRIQVRTQFSDIRAVGFASNNAEIITGVQTSVFGYSVDTREQIDRVDPGGRVVDIAYNPVLPQTLLLLERGARLVESTDLQYTIRDMYGSVQGETFEAGAFSRDGSLVAYVTSAGVYVWPTSSGASRLANIPKSRFMTDTFNYAVTDIEITPDNERLVLVINHKTDEEVLSDVIELDLMTGETLLTLEDYHRRQITDVTLSPDGTQLITASFDNDIYLWDLLSGAVQRRFVGHTESVNRVEFTSDGERLLSVGDDTAVILWDVDTSQELRRFRGHIAPVKFMNISPNGRFAVTSSGDDAMIVWVISGEDDVVAWAGDNRYIPSLSCIERFQYNVEPLCESASTDAGGG